MPRSDGLRRFLGWALIASALAGAGAPHTHSFFSAFEPAAGGSEAPRVVTHHNPLSRATHCHAVLRLVEDGCPACSAQRTATLSRSAEPRPFVAATEPVIALASASPRPASPLPKSPRAPPAAPRQLA